MAGTSAFASSGSFTNSSSNNNDGGLGVSFASISSPAETSLMPSLTETLDELDERLGSMAWPTSHSSVEESTNKRKLTIEFDVDDDDDDCKMPATNKHRRTNSTGSTDTDSLLDEVGDLCDLDEFASLWMREQEEERKERENAAMYWTPAGRAFLFVERMIKEFSRIVAPEAQAGSNDLQLVAQDDMVFLAEKLIECQDFFLDTDRATHVSLAYHYTRERHLQSIREGGLLSHPERQSNNIHNTKRGAYFGDGIYTGNNPYCFKNMGDTGLLVAILRGKEQRVGPGGATQDPNVNTVIGNKNRDSHESTDEIILLQSCQVLPILQYNRNMVDNHGRLEHNNGNTLLWHCHVEVQKIIDECFNGNVPTELKRITPRPAPTVIPVGNVNQSANGPIPAVVATVPTGWQVPAPAPVATNALSVNTAPKAAPANAISIQTGTPQVAMTAFAATPLSQVGGGTTASEKETTRQKDQFLMFTRVLMKYLETKDPAIKARVQAIIKECTERNKRQEPGYESVTASMRERLKHVVDDTYWKRAESYLAHFLGQKQKSTHTTGGSVNPVAASPINTPTTHTHNTTAAVNNNPATAGPAPASLQTASVTGTASSTQTPDNAPQKQKFVLEYLEFYHPNLYREALIVKSGCIKRHERKEPGYESLNSRVQEAILQVVGNDIWQKAISHADIKMVLLPSPNISFSSPHAPASISGTSRHQAVAPLVNTTQPHTGGLAPSIASGAKLPPASGPAAFPAVQSETLSYTAPVSLASAASCTRRIRTLEQCEDCCICQLNLQRKGKVLQLTSCGHMFHQQCITMSLQHDSRCPRCRSLATGVPQGKCPSGTMSISHDWRRCGGYENNSNGSIAIRYALPAGVALIYHENPGKAYNATNRVAYLPNNTEGRNLLVRLKYAWCKGLLFSIGTSLTTGKSGQIVWSSVHQKTSLKGGVHGWPDVNYFANVAAELHSLGVPSHSEILGGQTSVATMQGAAGP